MTHRPIAPIEINGFVPGGTPRALPIFEWVDPATLLVDEGYQRDSSERSLRLVRKIVSGWDWAKFKSPVAVMTDAGLELIDGQHTAIAAATHPDVETIPVMIVDVDKRAERAAAFIGHNKDRVAVTAAQLHVAAIAAGDREALGIAEACTEAGIRTLRAPSKDPKPGETMAINAIGALVRGRGKNGAVRVLKIALAAGIAPLTQIEIKAIDLLAFNEEYRDITDAALISSIAAMGKMAYSEAAVFRAAHPSTPLWKALAIIWFKNRRAKATPNDTSAPLRTAVVSTSCDEKRVMPTPPLGKTNAKIAATRPAAPTPDEDRPRTLLQPERKGDSISDAAKRDDRPELGRWQPGNHLRRCGPCGSPFVGGRRAEHCADCAYRAEEVAHAS
jgi:hypothetical protein